jgi:hypothetical protein
MTRDQHKRLHGILVDYRDKIDAVAQTLSFLATDLDMLLGELDDIAEQGVHRGDTISTSGRNDDDSDDNELQKRAGTDR